MTVMAAYIVPHPPLIVPPVGNGKEKEIRKTVDAFDTVAAEISELKPDTVVIITPHSIMYQDYIHISPGKEARGDFSRFGDINTQITASYDAPLVSAMEELAAAEEFPAGTLGERDKTLDHGTLVPLYFINKYLRNYKVVRVSVSGLTGLEHYQFGKIVKEAAEKIDRNIVVIASGDLSHRLKEEGPYSYAEEGPIFDSQITQAMAKGDFLSFMQFDEEFSEAAGECGLRGFITMAGTLDGMEVESNLLSYEGPFGVGYAVAAFHPLKKSKSRQLDLVYSKEIKDRIKQIREEEDNYVSLARLSLESYVKGRKYLERPPGLPRELLDNMAGVFVTIKKDGKLRGCIGTISPTEDNIAEEIIKNAVSAGTGDPRFDPVTPEELQELIYSVDVLGAPEPIASMEELDVIRYGVIVSKGSKRGLLLPNLEGVATPQQQVEIALKKAGISLKDTYRMERFEVVRHQ